MLFRSPVAVEGFSTGADVGIWSDEMLTVAKPKPKKVRPIITCEKCNAAISEDAEFCPVCSVQIAPESEPPVQKPPSKLKSFWYDLMKLLSPVSSVSDGINFFMLFILHMYCNLPLPGFYLITSVCGKSRIRYRGYDNGGWV